MYSSSFALVNNNRYLPLQNRPFSRANSRVSFDSLFMTASRAYNDNEKEVHLPQLCIAKSGSDDICYDLNKLGNALTLVGKTNPLRTEFIGTKIPWKIEGKLQAQGVACSYEQQVTDKISLGFFSTFLHVFSRHDFIFDTGNTGFLFKAPGDIQELEETRRLMHKQLGLEDAQFDKFGIGDTDFFIRIGNVWDYKLKFRSINAGISLGAVFPSGQNIDDTSAPSIPFGSGGHWGCYITLDSDFELKEDMHVQTTLSLSNYFKKKQTMRLSVAGEHPAYGALLAPVDVDPGVFFEWKTYFVLKSLRKGLGVRVGYVLNVHEEDSFQDLRSESEKNALPISFLNKVKLSGWASDYISLHVFYNFDEIEHEQLIEPTIAFSWDIPVQQVVAYNVAKTHKISLAVEFNF